MQQICVTPSLHPLGSGYACYYCCVPSSPVLQHIYTALVSLIFGTVIPTSFSILIEMFLLSLYMGPHSPGGLLSVQTGVAIHELCISKLLVGIPLHLNAYRAKIQSTESAKWWWVHRAMCWEGARARASNISLQSFSSRYSFTNVRYM